MITMAARYLRTSQIAKDLGVHVNTIRLYEADGLLPAIPRAPNDVGGLLDTSKGWTLNIPMPSESTAATREIAKQQVVPAEPAKPVTLAARE